MSDFRLTSAAFDHGERIPRRYGYAASNVNPPLSIEGVPEGTRSLVLIMDDPDAVEPAGKIWDHWLIWGLPADCETIPENGRPPGTVEGRNDYGEPGYGGPNPPDREHTYRFRLYALDAPLDLPPGVDRSALENAMEGHVLEETLLEGTYPAND